MYAYQPFIPKKRPSHDQYQNPGNILLLPFGSVLFASPDAGLLPGLGLHLTPPQHLDSREIFAVETIATIFLPPHSVLTAPYP